MALTLYDSSVLLVVIRDRMVIAGHPCNNFGVENWCKTVTNPETTAAIAISTYLDNDYVVGVPIYYICDGNIYKYSRLSICLDRVTLPTELQELLKAEITKALSKVQNV